MSFILWILSIAALLLAYLLMPHIGILCVLLVFFLAPIFSWILIFVKRKKIEINFTALAVVGKREGFHFLLNVHSHIMVPLGKVVMWIQLTNTATGEQQKKRICFHGTGDLKLSSEYCGCVECVVLSAWCYDLFGILPVFIACNTKKRIVVMPDTFPVEVDNILSYSELDDCTEYIPDKKGNDRTEILQIREYVPGDSIQQIHWKLSGKLEKLIVRDPSEPANHEVMVFLDRGGKMAAPAEADALMEAVTSVCQGFTEAGQPFCLAWNEEERINIYEINSKEQLPEAISAMLKSRYAGNAVTAAELFYKTMGNERIGSVLYFCTQLPVETFPADNVQIYLCGKDDHVISFTSEDVSDVLKKLSWS